MKVVILAGGFGTRISDEGNSSEKQKVTVVDTGLNTMTGGRVKRIREYVGNEPFMLTYGDGFSDVNILKLVSIGVMAKWLLFRHTIWDSDPERLTQEIQGCLQTASFEYSFLHVTRFAVRQKNAFLTYSEVIYIENSVKYYKILYYINQVKIMIQRVNR